MLNVKGKLFLIAALCAAPAVAHSQIVDGQLVKDLVTNLIDQTLKNPRAESGKVVYQFNADEACELFFGSTTPPVGYESACDTIAADFRVEQTIYKDSSVEPEGKLVWKYDGDTILSYTYSPTVSVLAMNFAEYRSAGMAILTAAGGDATAFSNGTPTNGAIEITLDSSVSGTSSMKVAFTEQFDHVISDYQISMAEDSYIQFITQPGSNLLTLNMNLDDSYVQLPGSVDYIYPSATVVKHDLGEVHGTAMYNPSAGTISLVNFKINNYEVIPDSVAGLQLTSPTAMTLNVDLMNFTYSAASAVDLHLNIDQAAAGILQPGDYRIKHDAGAALSTNLADSATVNLENFLFEEPADFLIAGGVSLFAAGTGAKFTGEELSGTFSLSVSGGIEDIIFDNIYFKNVALKEDAVDKISLNHVSGKLDGSISSDFATGGTLALGAHDLRIEVSDAMGIPYLSTGSFKVANGANTSLNVSKVGTGYSANYQLNNLEFVLPYGGSVLDFAENGSGVINYNPGATTAQDVLAGSIGSGHLTIGTDNLGTWTQTGATTINLDTVSAAPSYLVSFSNATVINVSHTNAIANFGTGSVSINAGASTSINNLTVTGGSMAIDFTGSPYATLFGVGGMLEGLDSAFACDTGVVGPCSVAVH